MQLEVSKTASVAVQVIFDGVAEIVKDVAIEGEQVVLGVKPELSKAPSDQVSVLVLPTVPPEVILAGQEIVGAANEETAVKHNCYTHAANLP